MKKQISMGILSFFLSMQHCVSMEQQPKICHLALVPKDVQVIIASYLIFDDRETDDELIERAQEAAKLPPPIELCSKYKACPKGAEGCMGCIASYLTDRSKMLYVEQYHNGKYTPIVSIVDTTQNKKTLVPQLVEFAKLNMPNARTMILSRDGILAVRVLYANHSWELPYEIRLKNLKSSDEKLIDHLPGKLISCEFNKQATRIIYLFCGYETLLKSKPKYVIYPISSEIEHVDKSKKTLAAYFRQNRVCKDLANSLK